MRLRIARTSPHISLLCRAAAIAAISALAACTSGGGALAPGLSERMDQQGASLNRADALGIVNQYRGASGLAPLRTDADLDAQAQSLADAYARSGAAPKKPEGIDAIRLSAGYANFAETFSGWRNAASEQRALLDPGHRSAGIGVAYNPDSTYGVYWVMLFSSKPKPVELR